MAGYPFADEPEAYATVREHVPFDPQHDAEMLRKAMKGFGTDEQAIIDILGNRTNAQRQHLYNIYKQHFGRDLISDLKSELTGKFEDAILAVMTPHYEYLVEALHKAISGIGTDEEALVEIMAPASNQEMQALKEMYEEKHGSPLEDGLVGETTGDFRRLLVSLSCGARDETPYVNRDKVGEDAAALFAAGEGQWGTDEGVFNQILVARSYHHLQAVFLEYENQAGRTIEYAIENETSGDLQMGLLSVVKCMRNRPAYFAERLYNSMKGAGTDDATLIRVAVSRSEIDMVLIKQEFEKNYGRTLEHMIAGDTGGDYKRLLLGIVQI